jgi:hypothetical protein
MDQSDLEFSNHRNFLTHVHGNSSWRAAAGAFDFRHNILLWPLFYLPLKENLLQGHQQIPLGRQATQHRVSCCKPSASAQARLLCFFIACSKLLTADMILSIIFSPSNLSISDIEFMRSQNSASAWPVILMMQTPSHLLWLQPLQYSSQKWTSIMLGWANCCWCTFAQDTRRCYRLQLRYSGTLSRSLVSTPE